MLPTHSAIMSEASHLTTRLPEDASVVEAVKTAAAGAYAAASEKNISRIVKMYEDAEVVTLTPTGVQSTVNGAYTFTSEGATYYAMTASAFGYGGPVNLLYIVDENGTIAKFQGNVAQRNRVLWRRCIPELLH